jgi:hypothetical protein
MRDRNFPVHHCLRALDRLARLHPGDDRQRRKVQRRVARAFQDSRVYESEPKFPRQSPNGCDVVIRAWPRHAQMLGKTTIGVRLSAGGLPPGR